MTTELIFATSDRLYAIVLDALKEAEGAHITTRRGLATTTADELADRTVEKIQNAILETLAPVTR